MSAEVIRLTAGGAQADLVPAWGGRVARLQNASGQDILRPLVQPNCDLLNWPKAGAFPLIPYNGRIRDAAFTIGSETIKVARHGDTNHSLHGNACKLIWHCTNATRNEATLQLDAAPDDHWPWAYRAQQKFRLEMDMLEIALSIENTSQRPMPAALGWHPYFSNLADWTTNAHKHWSFDTHLIPIAPAPAAQADVHPRLWFQEANSASAVSARGEELSLLLSGALNHLIILDSEPEYTCIEPVSHLPNHIVQTDDQHHCALLNPCQKLRGAVRLFFSAAQHLD